MVKIQNYNFQGPFSINAKFNEVTGVYVIYTNQNWIDVGETDRLATRIDSHERKPEWLRNANGLPIWLAFLGISGFQQRLQIESELRNYLCPLCGEK
jgi:hypothetical protein